MNKHLSPTIPGFLIKLPGLLVATTIALLIGCADKAENNSANADLETITRHHTIAELQERMAAGQLTSEALTRFYIDKIQREDVNYNAIIALNQTALATAITLDKERQAGKVRSLLHGIPIIVKDNIETADMATTAGSLLLKNNHTQQDADTIRHLRAAGAIVLAKANLSEWANFRSTRSSSGWSAVGGQTRNPVDPSRSPCGSSSGSGAAIAANFAVAAIGTETDGSITCPSSANGIVGIKPTIGIISQDRIVPISHTQDTAGPMTKNVTDAAIVMAYMADAEHPALNLEQALTPLATTKIKVGLLRSPAMDHEQVNALFNRFTQSLQSDGFSTTPMLETTHYPAFYDDSYQVLLFEFKANLNHYFASLAEGKNPLTLAQAIAFNRDHSSEEMPYFQQEIFTAAQEKGDLTSPDYLDALARIREQTRTNGLDKLFHENNVNLLLSVTLGPAWKIDAINGDHYTGGTSTFAAVAGYPHMTIPLGKVHGLPIGLSLIGPADSDAELIRYARHFEQLIATHQH